MKTQLYKKEIKDRPLVSIITPVYNAEKFLCDEIESVLSQTYDNWELLLIDDGSTDNSKSIALEYSKKNPKIKFFQNEKNSGTAFTRNVGLDNANGDIICLLDADDMYDSSYLEQQLEFYNKSTSPFIFCSFRRLAENSNTDYIVPKKTTAKRILYGSCLTPLCVMIDRTAIGDLRFKEDCYVEDLVFFYEILSKYGTAYGNQQVLATYRISANSKSKNKKKLIKKMWDTYHKSLHKNVFASAIYLFCWAVHGVIKYRKVK